jgi:hypothetical protein
VALEVCADEKGAIDTPYVALPKFGEDEKSQLCNAISLGNGQAEGVTQMQRSP